MKTPRSLFLHTRRWHDKVNGNTYFASVIEIGTANYLTVPFQYGYGDQDIYEAVKVLRSNGWNVDTKDFNTSKPPFDVYRVVYYATKKETKALVEETC